MKDKNAISWEYGPNDKNHEDILERLIYLYGLFQELAHNTPDWATIRQQANASMDIIDSVLGPWLNKEKGQSLVEMAIIAPILIFMFIGVLEVGWVLRGHLVLSNAARETARVAVRPKYLTFETQGYRRIVGHTYTTIAGQLDFQRYGSEIISVVEIDTQQICDPSVVVNDKFACDCMERSVNPYSPTLVITPMTVQTYTYVYPESTTKQTRIDFIDLVDSVVPVERLINCNVQMRGGAHTISRIVIVELFYDQPQLFGFPLISNPYTDPVQQYTWTTMRAQVVREIKKGG